MFIYFKEKYNYFKAKSHNKDENDEDYMQMVSDDHLKRYNTLLDRIVGDSPIGIRTSVQKGSRLRQMRIISSAGKIVAPQGKVFLVS